jgi:hypothetical protein
MLPTACNCTLAMGSEELGLLFCLLLESLISQDPAFIGIVSDLFQAGLVDVCPKQL